MFCSKLCQNLIAAFFFLFFFPRVSLKDAGVRLTSGPNMPTDVFNPQTAHARVLRDGVFCTADGKAHVHDVRGGSKSIRSFW